MPSETVRAEAPATRKVDMPLILAQEELLRPIQVVGVDEIHAAGPDLHARRPADPASPRTGTCRPC